MQNLVGPIIPLSWSNMVWKRVSPMDVAARGQLTAILLCWVVFGMVTPKQSNIEITG